MASNRMKRGSGSRRSRQKPPLGDVSEILADVRQLTNDRIMRISRPPLSMTRRRGTRISDREFEVAQLEIERLNNELAVARQQLERQRESTSSTLNQIAVQLVCELCNCLWYVKTRHLQRNWGDGSTEDADPRIRSTLGRISRGIAVLQRHGIEIIDKTGERYVAGSEGFMRPLDLLPTAGITFEIISQTMRPAISIGGTVVQAGDVFVAVPSANPDGPNPTDGARSRPTDETTADGQSS